MSAAAAAAAAVLVIWASGGYLRQVRARAAHPRLASWAVWACSMTVAAAGSGQLPAAALAGAGAVTAAAVLGCGWAHGDRDAGRLDAAAAVTGTAGVALLAGSLAVPGLVPAWAAVAASVATDAAAFAPTWVNAARGGEPAGPWVLLCAAAALALAAADWSRPAGVIFPAYELAACAAAGALALTCSPGRRTGAARTATAGPSGGAGRR